MRGDLCARLLRIRAVAPVAAVGAYELAVQPVHLRAAHLALLARRLQALLDLLFAHDLEYKGVLEGPATLAGVLASGASFVLRGRRES